MVAPDSVRSGLIERIRREVAHHRDGSPGHIRIKANSIVDEAVVDELYHASQAGVRIELLIRAICAVRPGVEGLSENIHVRSILGRFLEHSRVYWFANGGTPSVHIGSSDMMHRNLDRRVEVLVELPTETAVDQVTRLLDLAFDAHTSAWVLESDGTWTRSTSPDDAPLVDLQETLIAQHSRRRAK